MALLKDGTRVFGTLNVNTEIVVDNTSILFTLNTVFDQVNTGSVISSAGFDKANSANVVASAGFDKANSANVLASAAYDQANTGTTIASAGFDKANSANVLASAAFDKANSANIVASAAYDQANTGTTIASAAYDQANTGTTIASAAFDKANSSNIVASAAYDQANTGTTIASAAYDQANTGTTIASAAYDQANTGTTIASAAYDQANTGTTIASAAFDKANSANIIAVAAFDRANSKLNSSGNAVFTGDLTITGNLTVSGNQTFYDIETYRISDPLIYLAANNYTSDVVDIGFVANYVNTTGSNVHTGLIRDHLTKEYYLFFGYDKEPDFNHIDPTGNNFTIAILNSNIRSSNIILSGVPLYNWIESSYNQANTANTVALAAFDKANIANVVASAAFDKANSANIVATAAFDKANTANVVASAAFDKANSADIVASAAFDKANVANSIASAAYDQANTGSTIGSAAFDQANTANVVASAGFDKANTANVVASTAFDEANTANIVASAAFDKANSSNAVASAAFDKANTANVVASVAFDKANTANVIAAAAFDKANTANVIAAAAFDKANIANVVASTAFDSANSANIVASAAYNQANSAKDDAALAQIIGIGAFDKANVAAQNAFSVVIANGVSLIADSNSDTLTIKTTGNVSIIADASGDNLTFDLTDTGVSAATYGNNTVIPTFSVDSKGRLTSVSNTNVNLPVQKSGITVATRKSINFIEGNANVTINVVDDVAGDRVNVTISTTGGGGGDSTIASAAFDKANSANVLASAAFDQANSANVVASAAFDKANSANIVAAAAFDKANSANIVASASFDKANSANIVASASFDKANSANIVASASFDKANSANIVASASFDKANSANIVASASFDKANSANIVASASFDKANSANIVASASFDKANIANVVASAAYDQANTGTTIASAAFDKANSANVLASAGFDKANSANIVASASFDKANSANVVASAAYDKANSANIVASASFDKANSANVVASAAFDKANSANVLASASFDKANSANVVASAAFDKANSANVLASASFDKANSANVVASAAFDKANGATQLAFGTVVANGTSLVADSNNDTLTIRTTGNVSIIADAAGDNLTFDLTTTGVTAGLYGNSTIVPVITVDSRGRLSAVSNVTIDTSNKLNTSGGVITGDLTITGNLTVSGNQTYYDIETYRVSDPLIYLAANNYTSDVVDIGFVANYVNTTGSNVHTGLIRDHQTKEYYLFFGYDKEPDFNHIDPTGNNFTIATLNSNIKSSNIILSGVPLYDWIQSSFNKANGSAQLAFGTVVANGTSLVADSNNDTLTIRTTGNVAITADAGGDNLTFDLTTTGVTAAIYGSATIVPVLTVDSRGRLTAVTNTTIDTTIASAAFAKANGAAQLAFGTVVANGTSLVADSNNDTLTIRTTGNVAITADAGGDNLTFDLTTTGVTAATYGSSTIVPVLTVDSRGRLTAVTNTTIDTTIATAAFAKANGAAQLAFGTVVANGTSLVADSNNDTLTILTTGNVAITADAGGDNLTFDLTTTGVTAATYGSSTIVPVFAVDSRGRLRSVTNTTIDTTIATAAFAKANGSAQLAFGTVVANGTSLVADSNNDTLTIRTTGNVAITADAGGDNLTFDLTTTGVTAAIYGSATVVPVIAVDSRGRLTSVTNTTIDTSIATAAFAKANGAAQLAFGTVVANGTSLVADSNNDTLTILTTGNVSILGNATGDNLTFDLTTTGVTANTYGSATIVPVFTVDSRGRLTSVSNTAIDTSLASSAYALASDAYDLAFVVDGQLGYAIDLASAQANLAFSTIIANGTSLVADSNADTLTILTSGNVSIIGNATGDNLTFDLTTTGVTAATYGSATIVPVLTVDSRGRLTAVTNTTIDTTIATAAFAKANLAAPLASPTFTGTVTVPSSLIVQKAGDPNEGGEIKLEKSSGSSIVGNSLVIDLNADRLRIFEESGTNRGFFLDITKANTSADGEILHSNNWFNFVNFSSAVLKTGNTMTGNLVMSGANIAFATATNSGIYWSGTSFIHSPAANVLVLGTSSVEDMRITSDGKVGIGTSSPQANLHISSTDSGQTKDLLILANPASSSVNTAAQIKFYVNGGGDDGYYSAISSVQSTAGNFADLRFFTSEANEDTPSIERMRITAEGSINLFDNELVRPQLVDYSIKAYELTTDIGSITVNLELANYFYVAPPTGTRDWTFSNPPAGGDGGGKAGGFILRLTDAGDYTQNWPINVDWPGGTAPTLSTSGVDILVFITDDGGTTWRGVASMLDSR